MSRVASSSNQLVIPDGNIQVSVVDAGTGDVNIVVQPVPGASYWFVRWSF